MRAALLIVLLVPSAAAATEVHVTYDGASYVVGFESTGAPDVRVGAQTIAAEHVNGTTWRARLPAAGEEYAIDGRGFALGAPPSRTSATRIAVVGDMGTTPAAKQIVAAIAATEPDLVLIAGDLAYADADAEIWSDWYTIMEPLASRVPIAPAYGNHDDVCSTGSNSYKPCAPERNQWPQRFELPGEDLFYAFDWGPARITVLDSEAWAKDEGQHASGRAEQVDFLRGSLDGDRERWDLVMYHRPLRTTSLHEGSTLEAERADLEPILDAKADLVLAGHLHAYERSAQTEGKALYVTSGGGGRPLYDEWGPTEPWVATRAVAHHFVLLDITPTRIEGRTIALDGTTIDSFTLTKPAPTPPTPTPRTTPATTGTSSPGPTGSPPATTTGPPQESITIPLALPIAAVLVASLARRLRRS